ncbi:hypothetical protein, partial [Streptomyces sp. DSM 41029]
LLAVGGCLLLWVIGKTGRRLLAKAVGRLLKRAAKAFVRYVRITTADQARARLAWYMEQELPRRAKVMQAKRTSTWPTSME